MIIFSKVRFKNFLSYGNNFTEIELNKNPTTLFYGKNGSGKSGLITDSITFALFGKPYRKINKPQLVNSVNEKDCVVEIEFTIGSNKYLIRRGLNPTIFEIYVNGSLLTQDSANKDYQKYLENSILKLNYKSFTQVVILGSSTYTPFMQLTAADRRSVIEDLLDIKAFSYMNTILKTEISTLKERQKDLDSVILLQKEKINSQKKIIQNLTDNKNQKIEQNKGKIKESKKQLKSLEIENNELLQKISELSEKISENLNKETIDRTLLKTHNKENIIKTIETELDFYQKSSICSKCNQKLDESFKKTIITKLEDTLEQSKIELSEIIEEKNKLEEKLKNIQAINKNIISLETKITQNKSIMKTTVNYSLDLIKENETITNNTKNLNDENTILEKYLSDLDESENKKKEFSLDKNCYDIAYNLLKDTGIKSKIIKKYLPAMNKLVNKNLSLLDFSVNFEIDETFQEKIKSRYRDEYSYSSFSEGEKKKIDLAILFAWREVARMKNSVNTNLLILDETFDSSLDSLGKELLMDMIDNYRGINIFVISHSKEDTFKDKFSSSVYVEKVGNFSKILVA